MAKDTCITAVTAELEAVGLDYQVERGKNHPKIRFQANGRSYTYVVPGSASDHRSMMNCRSGIRRMLRELGLLASK